ncbi:unnamed protein product [Blepharisma stoltei]|uniref:protein-tyrosine-phosphatase n=1 Tax=Blepharisma stoltei TaxID=1481888 RepID=A0AAU9J6M8_9CILI|nr:unnamed protein product [Blepharisma stoltei]
MIIFYWVKLKMGPNGSIKSRTSLKNHMHKIDDFIYLGDQYSVQNDKELQLCGIKNILQLYEVPRKEHLYNYCVLPLPRGKNFSILPVVQESLRFIDQAISRGEKVLVHCKFGKNRSATIVIAYYMASRDWSYRRAYEYILNNRAIVPSNELKNQILSIHHQLRTYLDPSKEIVRI